MKNLHELKEFTNKNADPTVLNYFIKNKGARYQFSQISIYDKIIIFNKNTF